MPNTVTIYNLDGSPYWTQTFADANSAAAWLADYKTRSFWMPGWTTTAPAVATSTFISSFSPAPASIFSVVPSTLTVTFSQPMTSATVTNTSNWTITTTSGTISISSITLDSTGTVATLNITSSISADSTITLTALSGVHDLNGSSLTGTAAASYTRHALASITSWTPAASSGFFSLPATFTANFNAPLDSTTTQNVANWTATSTHGTITINSVTLTNGSTSSSAVISVTGSGLQTGDTVTIVAGSGIKDQAAQSLTGTTTFTWLLSTAAPSLVSSSPAAGVIGSVPTTVTVTFSQAMGASASTASNWAVTSSTGTVTVTAATLSSDGLTATLTLSSSTVYSGSTLTLTGSNLIGANGIALSGSNTLIFNYYISGIGATSGLPLRSLLTTSSWNQLLPENPTIASYSATQLANLIDIVTGGNGKNNMPVSSPGYAIVDCNVGTIGPIYLSGPNDPVVTIRATGNYGNISGSLAIPASAQAAGGTDAHLTILNLTTGQEWDFFQFNTGNVTISTGATLTVNVGGHANFLNATGWTAGAPNIVGSGWEEGIGTNGGPGTLTSEFGGIVTSAGNTLMAGVVTLEELQSGQINHALSLATWANNGTPGVWPATAAAGYPNQFNRINGGVAMPGPGSLIWSDLTDAQVDALGWDTFSTMILKAMHHYGAFCTDTESYIQFNFRQIGVAPAANTAAQTALHNWFVAHTAGATDNVNNYMFTLQAQTKAWFKAHWHIIDPVWLNALRGGQR